MGLQKGLTMRDENRRNTASSKVYNTLMGASNASARNISTRRNVASDDDPAAFFKKRAKSAENAIGTTLSVIPSLINRDIEDRKAEERTKKAVTSLDDIVKKYGFKDRNDFYNASDKAEKDIFSKYGFNSDDYWNKHAELYTPANANSEELKNLEKQRSDVISRMSKEDADVINNFDTIQNELKGKTAENANEATKASKAWEDFRKNSYVGKKINQDRGKFAGSALNTLSTAADIMLPTAGVAFNAVQGGLEGVADELEENGLENFNAERAGQNALTGAASGMLTGALNKGINAGLASRGGNLFKGGNKLTKGINNLGSKTALGRGASTIATGAARGALSGAVGGSTGAAISAAMNGQDVLQSALEGAGKGLTQGAITGGAMAGANMALNKTTPMQKINQMSEDWQKSGDNFRERLANTWEGDNSLAARLAKNPREALASIGQRNNLGSDGMGYVELNDNKIANMPKEEMPVKKTMAVTEEPASNSWDAIAQEKGYKNYDDLTKQFMEANPNKEPNAGNILDWMDNTGPNGKKIFTNAENSKQIKNKRAIVEEITSQFGAIDKPTMRQTKPNETFYNLYDKMGLTDGDQIRQAVHYAEPGELIPTMIREAAGKSGVVDLSDATKLVDDLKLNKRQNYKKTLNVLEDIIDSTPSTISGGKSGVDALQLQRTIEKMASDAMGTSGEYHIGNNVLDQTTAKNLLNISSSIGKNLDKNSIDAGAVDFVKNKYTAEIEDMKNAIPNEKWQDMVETKIKGAKTIGELRNSIKDLTRASIFIKNGDDTRSTMGGTLAKKGADIPTSKAGVTNRVVNTLYEKIMGTPKARQARINRYEKNYNKATEEANANAMDAGNNALALGEGTQPIQANSVPATQLYNMIGRTESALQDEGADRAVQINDLSNAIDRATANKEQTLDNLLTSMGSYASQSPQATQVFNSLYGAPSQAEAESQTVSQPYGNQYFEETGDMWTDVLGNALSKAIDDNDVELFGELYTMYQDALSKNSKSGSTSGLSATQQTQLAKFDSADNAIDELEGLFDNAGGGKGPIFGNLQSLAGDWGWDSNARTYNQLSEGLINVIAQAVGKTDSLNTEGEVQRALQLIPQLTDDDQTARNKLEELRRMLQTTKASYNTAYGVSSY